MCGDALDRRIVDDVEGRPQRLVPGDERVDRRLERCPIEYAADMPRTDVIVRRPGAGRTQTIDQPEALLCHRKWKRLARGGPPREQFREKRTLRSRIEPGESGRFALHNVAFYATQSLPLEPCGPLGVGLVGTDGKSRAGTELVQSPAQQSSRTGLVPIRA